MPVPHPKSSCIPLCGGEPCKTNNVKKIRILTGEGQNPVSIVYSKDKKLFSNFQIFFSRRMARSMRLARDMYIVLLLHLAWALMAVPVVTRQKRVPASAAAWLALILLLPVAGTLLYILAGYRRNGPAADCPDCRGDRLRTDHRPRMRHTPDPVQPRRAAPTATTPSRH